MEHISALLVSIVPTFGIIGVGWFCRRIGIWDKGMVQGLNRYAYYIALPALIFNSLVISKFGMRFSKDDLLLIGGVVGAHLALAALAFLFVRGRRVSKDIRVSAPMILTFGATAYVGIPYVLNTFGPDGASYAAILSVLLVVVLLFVSLWGLQRSGGVKDRMRTKEFLELPFVWAVMLGILFSVERMPDLPLFLGRTIEILGASAGPVALLAIGAFQYDLKVEKIPMRGALLFGAGKVILPALAVFFVLRALGVAGLPLVVGTAMGAVPAAITGFVLADRFKIGRELTLGTIFFSMFFSFVALTVLTWLWLTTEVFG